MPEYNFADRVSAKVGGHLIRMREEAEKSKVVKAGTERLSARDFRNRVLQMTPQQRLQAYRDAEDKDAFLRIMGGH